MLTELSNTQKKKTEKREKREHSNLTEEKKILNISRTRSWQSTSSMITQHLQRATVSNTLTLLRKCGLAVSLSSLNMLRKSINISFEKKTGSMSVAVIIYQYSEEMSAQLQTCRCMLLLFTSTQMHVKKSIQKLG
jgi:hypothetical protein